MKRFVKCFFELLTQIIVKVRKCKVQRVCVLHFQLAGSGSGKTRFFVKPNLMQMHSSYVVTDPKGTVLVECGKMLLKNGYKVKVLNIINFKKSMHYNPFAYIRSES